MKNTDRTKSFRSVMLAWPILLVALGIPALGQKSNLFAGFDPADTLLVLAERRAVLHVPRDYATIQAAVDAAAEGTFIQVAAGIYNEKVVVSKSDIRLHAAAGAVLDGTGLFGNGILVRGVSADSPVSNVEVSGFEVRNFERGIFVEFAVNALVHHNEVYQNVDKMPPLVIGDGTGIVLQATRLSEISQNFVHDNGAGGIRLLTECPQNSVHANRVNGNGTQLMTGFQGPGIVLTGQGTHNNRVSENEVIGNFGRGIVLTRPIGTAPITGNVVAQNRAHDNYRAGIAIMTSAVDNFIYQNDARWNNIAGVPPCYQCNLFELVVGTNLWVRNQGTSNPADASCAMPLP